MLLRGGGWAALTQRGWWRVGAAGRAVERRDQVFEGQLPGLPPPAGLTCFLDVRVT